MLQAVGQRRQNGKRFAERAGFDDGKEYLFLIVHFQKLKQPGIAGAKLVDGAAQQVFPDGGAIQAVFKVDTAVLQADQCLGKPPFVAFLGRRPQLCRFGIADEIVTLQHVRQKAVQFADEQFGPLKDKMILPVLLSLPEHPRDNFKKFLILFKLGFDVFELFLQVFLVTETVKAVPGHPDDKQRHHRQRRINRKVGQAESRRRNPAQTRKNVGSDIHKPRNGQKHGGKKAESEHGVFLLCSNKIYFAILIAFVRHFNQIFCRRRCCRRYSQFFKIIVEI